MKKLYFSIREVSELIDEEQHILRYWEKEFKILKPKKNSAGNRKYGHKDIDIIRDIKSLLRDNKVGINHAKEVIDKGMKLDPKFETSNFSITNNVKLVKEVPIEIQKKDLIIELEKILKETIDLLKN